MEPRELSPSKDYTPDYEEMPLKVLLSHMVKRLEDAQEAVDRLSAITLTLAVKVGEFLERRDNNQGG